MNEIFKGKVEPSTVHVGEMFQPDVKKDRFGRIPRGAERAFLIDTKYGQLQLPHQYGDKKIRIIIEVID